MGVVHPGALMCTKFFRHGLCAVREQGSGRDLRIDEVHRRGRERQEERAPARRLARARDQRRDPVVHLQSSPIYEIRVYEAACWRMSCAHATSADVERPESPHMKGPPRKQRF